MRRILEIAVLVLATLLPSHALAANTWGADFSDMWWTPQESGWGVNIVHQGDVVFMTLFVYAADSKPKWYVASSMPSTGGETSHAFNGTLYEATGPFLGGATFDTGAVANRAVGTASLVFSGLHAGTLTYSVDGVSVSKAISRYTFRSNDLSGSYFGAQVGDKTECGADTGPIEYAARYSIGQAGTDISINATLSDTLSCVYAGTYAQNGSVGSIEGTFNCTDGKNGVFTAADLEASDKGFLGRYFAQFGAGCVEAGVIGGVRR